MPNKIKPKRSYTANAVPTTSDLDANELAINWADGKAYTKNASGNIVSVTLGGGGGGGSLSATVTIPAIGDQYWNSVGLLLRGDGQNNGTVFTDSGPFNKSITRIGSAVTSTAQSKFGGSSLYFDGNNSGLQVGSAFDETIAGFGTGDFTVETWFRTSTTARSTLFSAYRAIASATGFAIQINRDLGSGPAFGSVGFGYGDTTILDTAGGLWSANTWHHLAVVRSGSTVSIFIDGVSRASTTNTTNMSDGERATVGCLRLTDSNLFAPYAGYLDDFRITKAARYTANFTPPTATHATGAYTAPVTLPVVGTGSIGGGLTWSSVPASAFAAGTAGQIAYDDTNGFFYVATATNTWKRASLSAWVSDPNFSSVSLLLPFDNQMLDKSSSPKTVTVNGNAVATGTPKYGTGSLSLGAEYTSSSTTIGGSYQNTTNTGDWLDISASTAFNFGSGDFTVELWYYPIQRGRYSRILGSTVDQPFSIYHGLEINSGNPTVGIGPSNAAWFTNASAISLGAVTDNQWVHLAVVRQGDTFRVYKDGVQQGTASTDSAAQSVGNITSLRVGRNGDFYNKCLIDDFRVTKGVCRYPGGTTFTPPTALPQD